MKYGYMDMAGGSGKSAPLLSKDGLRNYIREFQVGQKYFYIKRCTAHIGEYCEKQLAKMG